MQRTSYQQLQPEERMTIASMRQQGASVRAMARTLGRSATTVSRELARNTCPTIGYASAPAQARCTRGYTSRRAAALPEVMMTLSSDEWQKTAVQEGVAKCPDCGSTALMMGACAIGTMTVHQEYVCNVLQNEFKA